MPFISIIIPVYNAGVYLNQCIGSILDNEFDDYELILVDDGSTDDSWKTIKKYEKESVKIRSFRKQNSGVSDARNYGIGKAEGTYIYFVDSDDWIEPGTLTQIFNHLHDSKCDLLLFDYKRVINRNKVIYAKEMFEQSIIIDKQDIKALGNRCLTSGTMNNIGNKVYRAEIITKNNLRFDANIKSGEDWLFNLEFIRYSSKAQYVEGYYYNYRLNENSATNKFNQGKLNDFKMVHFKLLEYINVFSQDPHETTKILEVAFVKRYLDLIKKCFYANYDLDEKVRKDYISKILNDAEVRKAFSRVKNEDLDTVNRILLYMAKNKNYFAIYLFNKIIYSRLVQQLKKITRKMRF